MLDEKNRLKRQNLKLKEENRELKAQISELNKQLNYYGERVRILDEKEKEFNDLLTHVKFQQVEYQRILEQVKRLKMEIEKRKKK